MKQILIATACCFLYLSGTAMAGSKVVPAPNGIGLPSAYKDWRIISSSHREDNKTSRVILGNDIAIKAARDKKTNPWPNGSILGKMVWKDESHPKWNKATIPGKFVHAEFMIKDAAKYKKTGGWGFARWTGLDQKPYGRDASFVQECFGCHLPVKGNDYVFTFPSSLPK